VSYYTKEDYLSNFSNLSTNTLIKLFHENESRHIFDEKSISEWVDLLIEIRDVRGIDIDFVPYFSSVDS
jgi:hypothetical protein